MLKMLCGFLLLSTTLAMARTHETTISSIDYGTSPGEEHHLYLSDGYVVKVPASDQKEMMFFEDYLRENKILRIKTNASRELKAYQILGTANFDSTPSIHSEYQPTILSSNEEASRIFGNLKRGWASNSQCYNRAHIWVYESKNSANLNAMKVFMFYTRKYIRKYNFEWWFHVAPFTYVKDGETVVEKVLDPRFTRSPHFMKSWTDIFMKNDAVCPVITNYSQYENNQEAEYCYLYKTSMYYLQPLDLDNLERTGKTKTKFHKYEVDRAYRNGFSWWSW